MTTRTLARRLSRPGVWTSLCLACSMLALTAGPAAPLAWLAVSVNVVAAVVVACL